MFYVIILRSSFVVLVCILQRVHAKRDGKLCNETCEYVDWAQFADCRGCDLEYVPEECDMVEDLDIRNNAIKVLEPSSFAGYQNLRQVDMGFNQIAYIRRGAFGNCSHVLDVYLQFNYIVEVEDGAFEGAVSLEQLFLNHNSIDNLPLGAFTGLSRLTELYLSYNSISELPAGVFNEMLSLEILHMGDNRLNYLPPTVFNNQSNLRYLNLKNNDLITVDGEVFRPLKKLEKLDLSGNLIISVQALGTLSGLKILNLYDNMIENIWQLSDIVPELEQLYLAENNIDCVCLINPIREWIQRHITDDDVENRKANVTCSKPPPLKGQALGDLALGDLALGDLALGDLALGDLTQADLCPNSTTPAVTFTNEQTRQITTCPRTKSTHPDDNKNRQKQITTSRTEDDKLMYVLIYVAVAGGMFLLIVIVVWALSKYLSGQRRRSKRQDQTSEQLHLEELIRNPSYEAGEPTHADPHRNTDYILEEDMQALPNPHHHHYYRLHSID